MTTGFEREVTPLGVRHFSERLRMALAGRSVRSFARECGLSEGVLRSYLRGDAYPSLDRLEAIALAAEVNDSWLATGMGCRGRAEMFETRETGEAYRPMNEKLIGDIIELIETCLQGSGTELSPVKKKELILMAYDLSLAEGRIDRNAVQRLLKLAT
jgi:transcriptional regulator with XRE-family HTH domain